MDLNSTSQMFAGARVIRDYYLVVEHGHENQDDWAKGGKRLMSREELELLGHGV